MLLNLTAVAFLFLSLGESVPQTDWILERFHQSHEVSDGQPIEIANEYGDVRLRTLSASRIELSAVAQRSEGGPAPEFRFREVNGRLTVEVQIPDRTAMAADEPTPRIDIVIQAPESSPIAIRTIDGLVDARGLKREFEAATVRGDVRVRSESSCRIVNEQGSVLVSLIGGEWRSPILIETVVGDIRVELPQESHALVETSTAGELTTDYSTEISWQGLKKVGSTRIGDGEARIILRSQNGNIQLIRKKMH